MTIIKLFFVLSAEKKIIQRSSVFRKLSLHEECRKIFPVFLKLQKHFHGEKKHSPTVNEAQAAATNYNFRACTENESQVEATEKGCNINFTTLFHFFAHTLTNEFINGIKKCHKMVEFIRLSHRSR